MALPLLAVGAFAALKGLGSILGNKSKNDAAKAQQLAYNEWLKDRSKTVDEIAANLKSRGIDIFGPQVTYANQQAQQEAHSVFQQSSQMTKTVGKGQEAMYQKLNQLLQGRLGQTDFITPEEKAATEQQINKMQEAGRNRVGNAVSRMGLSPSTMQAAMLETPADIAANQARIGALANFAQLNRDEAAKARAEASGQLQAWQGQNTNTRGSSDSFSTSSGSSSQTAPPDYLKLLSFLGAPAPNQPVVGTGQSMAGDIMGAVGSTGLAMTGNMGGSGGGLSMPSNISNIMPSALSYGNQGAGGGTFMTTEPTTITVGDNPGGKEIVDIHPVSGRGQTHIDPTSGLIALKRLLRRE